METEKNIRYYLEHIALPNALYTEDARLLYSFLYEGKSAMKEYYEKAEIVDPNYLCPYSADDFSVEEKEVFQKDNSALIIQIGMPVPEKPTLCRAVYLCFGRKHSGNLYVTSELNEAGKYYLCCCMENHSSINYAIAPDENEFDTVETIYWEMINNGGCAEDKDLCGS